MYFGPNNMLKDMHNHKPMQYKAKKHNCIELLAKKKKKDEKNKNFYV